MLKDTQYLDCNYCEFLNRLSV